MRRAADDRQALDPPRRYITRPALANEPDGSTVTSISPGYTGSGIHGLASDSAGTVDHTTAADLVLPGGLYVCDPATGTSARLIVVAADGQVRLGSVNRPRSVVQSIAALRPKRLLVSRGGGQRLLMTLPSAERRTDAGNGPGGGFGVRRTRAWHRQHSTNAD